MKICSVEGCGKKVRAKGLCDAHDHKARYAANPEKFREQNRKRNSKYREDPKNKRVHNISNRKRTSGWTELRRICALAAQKECCAVCAVHMISARGKHNSANCDHCYTTGKPRAILCKSCNLSLGAYEKHQKPAGLVIEPYDRYIEKWAAIHAAEEQDAAE